MRNHVNLMSEGARFRAAARRRARRWAVAIGVLLAALTPLAAFRWQRLGEVRRAHEAMEAKYEPFRELNNHNRRLSDEAKELVRTEQIPLRLARKPTLTTLMGIASRAAAASQGELFLEQLTIAPAEAVEGETPIGAGRLVVEAAGTLAYDVSEFISALGEAPFAEVKVISAEVVSQDGVDRRRYTVECNY